MLSMNDYSVFARPDFDANEYANAVLSGESYPPLATASDGNAKPGTVKPAASRSVAQDSIAKEDISVAISKLTFAIDDAAKQIKALITAHHEELLQQAANASNMSDSLTLIRQGLRDLDGSAEKLRVKIHIPYEALQMHVSRLQKLHQASDVLRRTSRFIILARRLQVQVNEMNGKANNSDDKAVADTAGAEIEDEKERAIAKAALSIAELVSLLDGTTTDGTSHQAHGTSESPDQDVDSETDAAEDISLRSVNVVNVYEPFIQEARARVTGEMENMVLTGLETLNPTLLASSLQTAYNLRVLPTLIQGLLNDLSQGVEERIHNAFDLSKISKDALASDSSASPTVQQSSSAPAAYRSRVRTEPTTTTVPQYAAALWSRLEKMFEEMTECCIKVYTLEKVLRMKKDAVTQVVFLDEAMKLLENKPSATFWTSLARSLEKYSRDAIKGSTFMQNTLGSGYPRLLRLFHVFFARIAVHTDTVYVSTHQSPETVVMLRSISGIEALYLSRSTSKLNEAVGQAFAGGARSPPGATEGVNIARTVVNEMDAARFDPLLVKAVARIAATTLDMMVSRSDNLATRDRSAFTFVGSSATPPQMSNAQLASFLYNCWTRLAKLANEYPEAVYAVLQDSVQNIFRAYERITEPLLAAIRRDLGAIIASMHHIDFGKTVDPLAGMGRSSLYTKELTEKLGFFKTEILSKYDVGDVGKTWVISIVKYVMKTFLLHASIVKPLAESGKLQLTSDMTEIEFALNTFMVDTPRGKDTEGLKGIGSEYKALRAMRHLLFLENAQLTSPNYTADLPVLIILHHILVRSPIPLPHKLHGWQEAEYVRWVDEHSDVEAFTLVDTGLSHWEKVSENERKDRSEAAGYVKLARAVLQQAQGM